ncbi:Tetratricopeptide repeat protein [Hyella patelloides LEGE 07179]|uniref:Tetratricopeptide repeat protein n=1 Tax=Hyella patelloides LEGE 07179 TaxID=945734 RepID=A0A563W3W7_9CYAN|nr:Sll0314/Alr1548 family TPR repeat-containing protein [Hyella patelloides]VEP18389.1 Tetratricopeptide repeat protein [Hyella patelloides LEGE 07179]
MGKIFSKTKFASVVVAIFTTTLSFNNLAFAADPFRTENSRDLGEHTEEAFETIFLFGDYKGAKNPLQLAEQEEAKEPLAYALLASLAYTEKDWETLKAYALKTLQAAESLSTTDPLRSNLYQAVGHFMEGAYLYEEEGAVSAIQKLQLVFKYFDAAEDIEPDDPELNLIKGYVDLLLAVNLPFSSPEQAIARFEKYASPDYLVDRGIAVAYRDLKDYNKALESVNQALEIAPDNPENYYLKGQILRKIGKKNQDISILEEALEHFSQAASKEAQLPSFIVTPLKREMRQTQEKIDEIKAAKASR